MLKDKWLIEIIQLTDNLECMHRKHVNQYSQTYCLKDMTPEKEPVVCCKENCVLAVKRA